LSRHGRIGRHNFSSQHAGRWLAANRAHVLDKSAQFCKVLGNFRRSNECALAATNFDKTPAHEILNCPPNGYAANAESLNQAVLGRQLLAGLQLSFGNLAGEDRFDARIE
jgi:hypothetical protein